jgi:hypothetical protein
MIVILNFLAFNLYYLNHQLFTVYILNLIKYILQTNFQLYITLSYRFPHFIIRLNLTILIFHPLIYDFIKFLRTLFPFLT